MKYEQGEDGESTLKLEMESPILEYTYLNIPSRYFSEQFNEEPIFHGGAFPSAHYETYDFENSTGSGNLYLGPGPPPNPALSTPSSVPGIGFDYSVSQGYGGFATYASGPNQNLSGVGFLHPSTAGYPVSLHLRSVGQDYC